MINDEQVRWIALFFLFSFMDKEAAIQAAHKAVAQLKAGAPKPRPGEPEVSTEISKVTLIRTLRKIFEQQRKHFPRSRPAVMPDATWNLADKVDLGPWIRFQRDASDQEVTAVVFSKILTFSDQEIADGLGVSLGTARYRVGKGMRHLGEGLR